MDCIAHNSQLYIYCLPGLWFEMLFLFFGTNMAPLTDDSQFQYYQMDTYQIASLRS